MATPTFELEKIFHGASSAKVDGNGRIGLSQLLYSKLKNHSDYAEHRRVVAALNPWYRCIVIYPKEFWDQYEKEYLQALNTRFKQVNNMQFPLSPAERRAYACHQWVELDSNHRFVIPPALRHATGILENQEAIVLGAVDFIEIWHVAEWQNLMKCTENLPSVEGVPPNPFAQPPAESSPPPLAEQTG